MMRIVKKADQQIVVLSLVGDPLGEPDAQLLRKNIYGVVNDKIRHVIIDLTAVKHINSAGLGGLIAAMFTMLKSGGDLSFTSAGTHVRESFRITKLDKVFTIYESVEDALTNYRF